MRNFFVIPSFVIRYLRLGLLQLAQGGLAAELDAVLLVDRDHLDLDLVADFAYVAHALHVAVGQFANVAQAVFAGQDFDERAKVLDTGHAAVVNLADLDALGEGLDATHGGVGAVGVGRRDDHRTVVLDLDDRTGHFLDRADRLAPRADKQAD